MEFEILFEDLTKDAQKRLCEEFKTTLDDENWDIIPLTIIEREEEEDEKITFPGEYEKITFSSMCRTCVRQNIEGTTYCGECRGFEGDLDLPNLSIYPPTKAERERIKKNCE